MHLSKNMHLLWLSLLAANQLLAQSGSWKLSGNSLAGTEKIGSTNDKPLRFYTNNQQRMTLTPLGQLGVGTSAPNSILHLKNGSFGGSGVPSGTIFAAESNLPIRLSLLSTFYNETGISFGNEVNNQDGQITYNAATNRRGISFHTSGAPKMALDYRGWLGIGVTKPLAKLHVQDGASGAISANPNARLIIDANSTNFINLLTPRSSTSGVLFGDNVNAQDGGIIYNSNETKRGIQFNTNGNNTRMVVAGNGNVGIGTKTPDATLHILHPSLLDPSSGLKLQTTGSNKAAWSLHVDHNDGSLNLWTPENYISFFDVYGAFHNISDFRFKKDIEQSPDILEQVLKLQVKKYRFINSSNGPKHVGMIAQEVEKLFPELVGYKTLQGKKILGLNYAGFGVLAIKAIQEQQIKLDLLSEQVERQNHLLHQLQQQLNEGLQQKSRRTDEPLLQTESRQAIILQISPNPARNSIVVSHYLPAGIGKAALTIATASGEMLQSIALQQTGKAQTTVQIAGLTTGTYFCSLIVDGTTSSTKQIFIQH